MWLCNQVGLVVFTIIASIIVILDHENGYGKNDYNHERKNQDAYLIVESTLFCWYYWFFKLVAMWQPRQCKAT
jgi:hypothetical protein